MSLFRIALRSIQQRGVASLLTMFSMALGVMLVVAVLSIHGVVAQSFRNNASLGYNMIVGAKGGKQQLVLNTVYYLSEPVENVPYTYYLEFLRKEERERLLAQSYAARGRQALAETAGLAAVGGGLAELAQSRAITAAGLAALPDMNRTDFPPVELDRHGKYGLMTQLAIPVCLGDYYGRFRVVGTTPQLFDELVFDIENNRKFEFAEGRNFRWHTPEHSYFEAVVGSRVARETRLVELHFRLGDATAAAAALLADAVNWSRIEERDGLLVVVLGNGAAENDVQLAIKRLRGDAEKGKRTLSAAQDQAIDALLNPAALVRRGERRLMVGDAISPAHGDPEGHVHARKFTVVGILAPSGTPNDRAVFVNMEGFYLMEDHAKPLEADQSEDRPTAASDAELRAQMAADAKKQLALLRAADPDPLPVEQREVSAVLLKVDPMIAIGLENAVNEGKEAQAVLPVKVIFELFESIVNPIQWTLLLLTAMICVVSGISILVSIYNSMSERRGEIAVMRALGAGRGTVMTIILLEATLLALAGGAIGWLAGHTASWAASPLIEEQTGVHVGFYSGEPSFAVLAWLGAAGTAAERFMLPVESVLIPALILLAVLVGIWPAISAYRTDVARSLGK